MGTPAKQLDVDRSKWGDGSDGDKTVVGTETMTRDMYWNDITFPDGTELKTNGYRPFARGTADLQDEGGGAIVSNDGDDGSAGGAGGAAGTFDSGGDGATGAGQSPSFGLGGAGGAGSSGAGGIPIVPATANGGVQVIKESDQFKKGRDLAGNQLTGGGGGGGDGFANVGGGGGGLCHCMFRVVKGTGTIRSNGGDGETDAGGGGGGSAGLLSTTGKGSVTLEATGGTAGAGGVNGSVGTTLDLVD